MAKNDITETGMCPDCGGWVIGIMRKDEFCFTTWCEKCQKFLLEDEVGWGEHEK